MDKILIECHGLTKKYGTKTALDNITIKLSGGKIIGLLGPNGSGKTTFIKLATGLLTPTSGELLLDGKKPGIETKAYVSYLSDCMSLPNGMKVIAAVDYYSKFFSDFDSKRALLMIEKLGINPSEQIKTLSKGTKEKVQLILTMSRNARIYLLDEPMGGVDPATRDYILSTIITNYNENAAVVISTHLIADVEKILDEIVFIGNGQIVYHDSVDSIRETKGKSVDELFREVFKC